MKIVILCLVFLIVGAAVGSTSMAYIMSSFQKRSFAMFAASDLGLAALQAELIKQGETATVLKTLEDNIPDKVIMIHENDEMRDETTSRPALVATKRFYVCTDTPVPERIAAIIGAVELPANACEPNSKKNVSPNG